VTHQASGWTAEEIVCDYLKWPAERVPDRMVLMWNLFDAPRDEVVKEKAQN
jgi:hypothetical protein